MLLDAEGSHLPQIAIPGIADYPAVGDRLPGRRALDSYQHEIARAEVS